MSGDYFHPSSSSGGGHWDPPLPPGPPPSHQPQLQPQFLNPNYPYPQVSAFPPPPPLDPNISLLNAILNARDANIYSANNTYGHFPTPTHFSISNPSPPPTNSPFQNPSAAPPPPAALRVSEGDMLCNIDRAVETIREDFIAAGRYVSAWKVLDSALRMLNVDAEARLRLQLHQVPSLHRLMLTEGRVYAFIHCFAGVRRIITLYDLEVAICKNEAIDQFEELGLGPLLRHPLVLQYFSVTSETTQVLKITCEKVMQLLNRFEKRRKKVEDSDVEDFFVFLVKKLSVARKEELGVRIQTLGALVSGMREAWISESAALSKSVQHCVNRSKRRQPIFSSLKKRLDKHFRAISQQSELFPAVQKSGNQDRPVSSNSMNEVEESSTDGRQNHNESNGSVKRRRKCEISSPISVPPKLLKREKVELGALPTESDSETKEVQNMCKFDLSIANNLLRSFVTTWREECREQPVTEVLWTMLQSYKTKFRRTKRILSMFSTYPLLGLLNVAVSSIRCGMWDGIELTNTATDNQFEYIEQSKKDAPSVGTEHTTEHGQTPDCLLQDNQACQNAPGDPVRNKRRKIKNSGTPVREEYTCYHCHQEGHLQRSCPLRKQKNPKKWAEYPAQSDTSIQKLSGHPQPQHNEGRVPHSQKCGHGFGGQVVDDSTGVFIEELIRKIATYFEIDRGMSSNNKSLQEKIFSFFRKLCKCELWLLEEYSVKEFNSLGFGEFTMFLEKYARLLPQEMCKYLIDDCNERFPLEVCMLPHHLIVLVSQALNSIWEGRNILEHNIASLLSKQFPSLSFQIMKNGSLEDFQSIVGKHNHNAISKCVLFSMTIFGTSFTHESLGNCSKNSAIESSLGSVNSGHITDNGSVSSKDAIEALLRAPMLSDLNLWSHWDLLFAPSLGPLVPWLLNEVNINELLCLVTKDGKVIRLDHSATVDSFLEAALQGSSFQTAVKLLSLFSLVGGEKHAPMSLLKFHIQHAFESILKTYLVGMEVQSNKRALGGQKIVGGVGTGKLCGYSRRDSMPIKLAESVISNFFLDCLGHLPAEFRRFAADVLLCGMRSVFKHAASAILDECIQMEQRIMLHEVGLSLGIVEWIGDYHAFCSLDTSHTTDLFMSEASAHNALRDEWRTPGSKCIQDVSKKFAASEQSIIGSIQAHEHKGEYTDVCVTVGGADASDGVTGSGYRQQSTDTSEHKDASQFIESIRKDEFGLDSSLLNVESAILKKQHARLGRALHCLSQELYSQDSHFLLELVQNADDNTYPTNVEPTLAFILLESAIVVLNNEQGFSAQNIRALCDVGNSTKKGSNAGYIGQKGIGFKSVFRVTDAPEIHSNGFHIKFDTSEGQIGLILPAVVPPCNFEMYRQLITSDNDHPNHNCWNTCIVLPLRSKVPDGTVMRCIMNMFSDLHPSLLLFLHRLKCIRFRNLIDDSLVVMRKETVGDGIVKVSQGSKTMTWFVATQKLQSDIFRSDVQTTEISIAFTLKESESGIYSPDLSQQPAFAFLPLRTYGLKVILQGDFVLPSSREEVDGDSPWNQWLLSEYPALFVDAEKSFCSLPCFRENPGTAVAAYMSFVPLVGEVHGFFSSLPRLIISKLRVSNCLLVEGENKEWVPPCKVLRGWSKQARSLLSDGLLHEHLGLGFLDKDIVLPDSLARVLGIAEYGPMVLLQILNSLCGKQNGLKSMGMGWLASWLSEVYHMSFKSFVETSFDSGAEMGFIEKLQKVPFIPLSDGTYGAVVEGPIWLHCDDVETGCGDLQGLESFPNLYANLRIVSPGLLASTTDMSPMDVKPVDKVVTMLRRIGAQQLSAHEIIKKHILPDISDGKISVKTADLMADYACFAMVHLQSSCSDCHSERDYIMSELQNKAYILTNNGLKQPADASIHFSKEFGNPVDINKFNSVNLRWDEVDNSYLKHPASKSLPNGSMKWREFFQKIGIADFVKVVQVEKDFTDVSEISCNNVTLDISPGLTATDWESPELVHLLSLLSRDGNRKACEYLFEVLDTLWDDCYSDRATGYIASKSTADRIPFRSSFMSTICNVQWVISGRDDKLHYPKDLYHDCVAVRSILGASAPFSVPKANSEKFVSDVGFKTRVSLDDALEILKQWRCENPFRASLTQMSKLYSLIWNEMASPKKTTAEQFHLEHFIFVPYDSSFRHEDVLSGRFLSPEEVYWDDSTFFVNQIKEIHRRYSSADVNHGPINKFLSNFYPALHDFFVDICGVHEIPPLRSYLQILLHLSKVVLPSQAANVVFQVFLRWTDGLKSDLSAEDIVYLKDSLKRTECTVLPTVQDKWVSLHPSYGLVCWCDNKKLKKQFMHLDGIEFLYFGELSTNDEHILCTKMSILMQTLGIPALSEVVTHEAFFDGQTDSNFKTSVLDWALPYAQRYLHTLHPDTYSQLKQSGFDFLNCLRVVEVQKLSYRNVIKMSGSESKKQLECSCLLQGNNLYTTQEAHSHTIFMELSRLFFDGKPEIHLANFLHMITTMAESGSTEEQIEFFIFNSQNVPKLPDGESVWSLSYLHSLHDNDSLLHPITSGEAYEQNSLKFKRKLGAWPFASWKTPPIFGRPRNVLEDEMDDCEGFVRHTDKLPPISVDIKWTDNNDVIETTSAPLVSLDSIDLQENYEDVCCETEYDMDLKYDPTNLDFVAEARREFGSSDCSKINQPRYGTSGTRDAMATGRDAAAGREAMLTGRLGELVAYKYLIAKAGKSVVKWVNEGMETGLPYDIVIGNQGDRLEFIEVKATQSHTKDWFNISMNEWRFAEAKGESFGILHVLLLGNNAARVSFYRNPVKLCQLNQLKLHISMRKQEKELFLVS